MIEVGPGQRLRPLERLNNSIITPCSGRGWLCDTPVIIFNRDAPVLVEDLLPDFRVRLGELLRVPTPPRSPTGIIRPANIGVKHLIVRLDI